MIQYNAVGAEAVVLARIKAETIRAKGRTSPDGEISLERWVLKIQEEAGEVAGAFLDYTHSGGYRTGEEAEHFENELVQLASAVVRLLAHRQNEKEEGARRRSGQ